MESKWFNHSSIQPTACNNFDFHKQWKLKCFSGIFQLLFNLMSVFVESLWFCLGFYFPMKTCKNNHVRLLRLYIKIFSKGVKVLTVCASAISERNTPIAQKHHLPFVNRCCHGKCFHLIVDYWGWDHDTMHTRNVLAIFIYLPL